jgi:predicted ATP-dependent serine protease
VRKKLSTNTLLKTTLSKTQPQPTLSLNMRNINQLFPGFTPGDFALLHGSPAVTTLTTLLCVRAQLPPQLGGLSSNVVFIDGANTFRLYQITRLARLHQLNPKQVLDHIYISRAFTAYQMASLILQKLEDAVTACNAKLVIVSDIATMFLDKNVQEEEAKRIYSQITTRLSKFAKEHQAIIVTTYPPHEDSKRNLYLHALTSSRANVIIKLRQTRYEREIILEKHPTLTLGSAELPAEILPLTAFMEA